MPDAAATTFAPQETPWPPAAAGVGPWCLPAFFAYLTALKRAKTCAPAGMENAVSQVCRARHQQAIRDGVQEAYGLPLIPLNRTSLANAYAAGPGKTPTGPRLLRCLSPLIRTSKLVDHGNGTPPAF